MSNAKKVKILERVLGSSYQSSSERLYSCPRCEHHKKKLSVNLEKNVFKCWVCDWSGRDVYRIVRRYGTHSEKTEWRKFSTRIAVEDFAEKIFGTTSNDREESLELPREFISLANKKLPATALYPMNYLKSRGITKKDIIRWKIGYCSEGEYTNRIIIPSFNLSGDVNYFIARTYTTEWKKYMNPSASRDIIFNHLYLDFDDELVLVEGAFDAIVAGPNAVPILGSTLREDSKLFQEIVINDTPVFLALDQDVERKAMKLISSLMKYDIEVYKVDISPHSDVGEMPKEEFCQRKQNASLMNPENYLLKTIFNI